MNPIGSLKNKNERKAPVRVLLVGPSLRILGGQAVQAERMRRLLGEEKALEVAFLPVNPQLPGPLGWLQRIRYVRTVVTSIAYWALLLWRVRGYDVIHAFSASYWSFLLAPVPAVLAANLYGKPSLVNYRSGEASDHLANWPSAAWFLRRATAIVVPSGFLVDVFGRFGFQAEAIPNSVDTARFRYRERSPLRPVFLSNRNLEPLYNVACILRAYARLERDYPGARLLVAGDGSQRAELEALTARLELRGVSFLGQVSPEAMAGLYDQADIYLNAPNLDNMPASILESYASGLPVASTNAGGIPYIVRDGETGLLVNPDDDEALAAAAARYLREPAFAAAVMASARLEMERYRWDGIARQWVALYQRLAGAGRC
ncbi:MAG: glycosyltransferase [Acidobacteriota bacterium]